MIRIRITILQKKKKKKKKVGYFSLEMKNDFSLFPITFQRLLLEKTSSVFPFVLMFI